MVWPYAAHNPSLKAEVAWNGAPMRGFDAESRENPIDLAEEMKAPALGLYGAADGGIPNDTVEKMREALEAPGKTAQIVLYPDTPHGLHADYRPS